MTDNSERILDEAMDWLLLLTEKPEDYETRTEFEQWLNTDPQHAAGWKSLNYSYDLIGKTQPELTHLWQTKAAPPPRARGWLRRRNARRSYVGQSQSKRPMARKITAAALVALLVLWSAPSMWLSARSDYRTGTAQLRTVKLDDGSTAQLGPNSAIRIRYGTGERRIELLAGQALFAVQPDKARPFRVLAGDVTTTVLGTGFDVRRLPSLTEVGVQHGRVRVDTATSPDGPVFLGAGDRVSIDGSGNAQADHGSPLLIAAWAHSEVNARDRTVEEVIDEIRPWYSGRIILADKAIAAKRVNGIYNPRDVPLAVRSMVTPLGGSVTQITPWLIIVGL